MPVLPNEPNKIYVGVIPLFGDTYSFQPNGYTPKSAIPNILYSGNAPVAQSYGNVEEPFDILIKSKAMDINDVVLSKRNLETTLTSAMFSLPALLKVRGFNQAQMAYAEIYSVKLQEVPEFIGKERGAAIMRVSGSWIRSPFFSSGSLTAMFTGVTMTNTGTGANNNVRSYGALLGDLVQEGQPINLQLNPSATGLRRIFLASVYQRVYDTTVAGGPITTSGASTVILVGGGGAGPVGFMEPARTRNALRMRVLLRVTNLSLAGRVRLTVMDLFSTPMWVGPWVAPGVTAAATILDLTPQGIPLDIIRLSSLDSGDLILNMEMKSADGTLVSITLHSLEYLLYYTFCSLETVYSVGVASPDSLNIEQANNLNNSIYVPSQRPRAFITSLNGGAVRIFADQIRRRGQLPRAFSGASLYLCWMAGYVHTNTDTVTITASHLPLFRTFRGAV